MSKPWSKATVSVGATNTLVAWNANTASPATKHSAPNAACTAPTISTKARSAHTQSGLKPSSSGSPLLWIDEIPRP